MISRIYKITEIPDANDRNLIRYAGGDVLAAVWRAAEQLLRSVAQCDPGAISMSIMYVYVPNDNAAASQSRLAIYLRAIANDEHAASIVPMLFEGMELGTFYSMNCVETVELPWDKITAGCDIVRVLQAIAPLVSAETNYRIPKAYCTIMPFVPNENHDYMELERRLNELKVPVVIDVGVEPILSSPVLAAHAVYLAQLKSINACYNADEYDANSDLFENVDRANGSRQASRIQPLQLRDPMADHILQKQLRFDDVLHGPMVRFHFRVLSTNAAVARHLGVAVAENAFADGTYAIVHYDETNAFLHQAVDAVRDIRVQPAPVPEQFSEAAADCFAGVTQLVSIATVKEFSRAYGLPVAVRGPAFCIRAHTDPPITDFNDIIFGLDAERERVGQVVVLKDNAGSAVKRGIPAERLLRGMCVTGEPGSGKTASMKTLLKHAYAQGIPFLVLELAKTEYRSLKMLTDHPDPTVRSLATELEIYTIANSEVSPMRLNLLEPPAGMSIDEHADMVRRSIAASAPLPGPLPTLLGDALDRVLYDNRMGLPPTMRDLKAAVDRVMATTRYSPEMKNDLTAAIEQRVGALTRGTVGREFQCPVSIPSLNHILHSYTVIELDRMPRDEAATHVFGMINALRAELRNCPYSQKTPRLVLVVDESHVLIRRNTNTAPSPDTADPSAHVAETFERMLVELRALGVAVIIADQHPTAVAAGVMKSTGTKIAFRQTDEADRLEIAASMLMTSVMTDDLGRLGLGESFVYTSGYYRPCRIRTYPPPDVDLERPPTDAELLAVIRHQKWYRTNAVARVTAELNELNRAMTEYDRDKLHVIDGVQSLLAHFNEVIQIADTSSRRHQLSSICRRARRLHDRLRDMHRAFCFGPYRCFMPAGDIAEQAEPSLAVLKSRLIERWETTIQPDTVSIQKIIDNFVCRCQRHAGEKP